MSDRPAYSPLTIERRPAGKKGRGKTSAAKPPRSTLVVASDDDALLDRTERWLELLRDRLAEADERQIAALVEVALPAIEPPPPAAALRQARRNAQARMALLQEFGALNAEQVHALAGSRARNRFALATRWRKEGRIIGVSHGGKTYYPGFQFGPDGQPLEVVGKVIAIFGQGADDGGAENSGADDNNADDWQTALWFTLANGWLGGRRPIDLLRDDPEAVVNAAQQETADAF